MTYYYTAIFEKTDDGYTVSFPSLRGCVTEGSTFTEAAKMAEDALCSWLSVAIENGDTLPEQELPIPTEYTGTLVSIKADLDAYAQANDTQPIRRTISLPKWMDDRARIDGLSLSKITQDALKARWQ